MAAVDPASVTGRVTSAGAPQKLRRLSDDDAGRGGGGSGRENPDAADDRAQPAMPCRTAAAIGFGWRTARSGLRAAAGPVDQIVQTGVAAAGAVGAASLVYTAQSLIRRPAPNA